MLSNENNNLKPILKWAGGKTQLLSELLPKIPKGYGRYIEPFIGGGALFFAVQPDNALIADSNPELINMYKQVAENVDTVIDYLKTYRNTKEMFYEVRSLDWTTLPPAEAAARMLYLNKTCFNGLYRVNRNGQFNTPFANYKNPNICDETALHAASELLKRTEIRCCDYLDILKNHTKAGDFIFLDPPYLPISDNCEFKRYTKEQFYYDDHIRLGEAVKELYEKGCFVLLTNSNHPLVFDLFKDFKIDVIQTKRHISCKGNSRTGEDVIVTVIPPLKNTISRNENEQTDLYPTTRFMGSKRKLLNEIWSVSNKFEFESVLDLFSGSGVVGYMYKAHGKRVICNDYMAMSATFTKAMVENNNVILPIEEAKDLMIPKTESDHFVAKTFKDIYFYDEENELIDIIRTNIKTIEDSYKKSIAMSALIRACTKKRARGLFTYVGHRYDDGRKDLHKSLEELFIEAVKDIDNAIFDNGKNNLSIRNDAMSVEDTDVDLVYIDPPYYNPLSDNEYVRRYHFLEGLAIDWQGVEIQENTKTKKFKSYPTPFATRKGAEEAFDKLFEKYARSILIVSYSSNSQPSKDEMINMLSKYKEHVEVVPVNYTYGFGNQSSAKTHRNAVQEYLFIGY